MTFRELAKAIDEMGEWEKDNQATVWPENDTPPRSHFPVLRLGYIADAGAAIVIDRTEKPK